MAACICERGYERVASGSCSACSEGSYKTLPGNLAPCLPCPTGFTTFSTGSRGKSACAIPVEQTIDTGSNQSDGNNQSTASNSTNVTGDAGTSIPAQPVLKNESAVPAITFNMTIAQLPADGEEETLKNQLKATPFC